MKMSKRVNDEVAHSSQSGREQERTTSNKTVTIFEETKSDLEQAYSAPIEVKAGLPIVPEKEEILKLDESRLRQIIFDKIDTAFKQIGRLAEGIFRKIQRQTGCLIEFSISQKYNNKMLPVLVISVDNVYYPDIEAIKREQEQQSQAQEREENKSTQ